MNNGIIYTFVLLSCGNNKEHFTKPLGDSTATDEPRGFFIMESKVCSACGIEKSLQNFTKQKAGKLGRTSCCNDCKRIDSQLRRKTKEGVITCIYASQLSASRKRNHPAPSYSGKELKDWLMLKPEFHEIYDKWVVSDYNRYEKPSCDRIDDYKGYSFDNIRLVSWMQNYTRSHSDKMKGFNNKQNKAVIQLDLDGNFIKEFHSASHAERELGLHFNAISRVCRKEPLREKAGGFRWAYKQDYPYLQVQTGNY